MIQFKTIITNGAAFRQYFFPQREHQQPECFLFFSFSYKKLSHRKDSNTRTYLRSAIKRITRCVGPARTSKGRYTQTHTILNNTFYI
ncbi:hypothetical protein AGDE_16245 [Angomonas deanei]|nr:hypothetical protein AGDE_16245 [Angomonas deanei]|eukprot:EPY17464.1 hypothetical protein AGDE_16245 [Angomonas deanei]